MNLGSVINKQCWHSCSVKQLVFNPGAFHVTVGFLLTFLIIATSLLSASKEWLMQSKSSFLSIMRNSHLSLSLFLTAILLLPSLQNVTARVDIINCHGVMYPPNPHPPVPFSLTCLHPSPQTACGWCLLNCDSYQLLGTLNSPSTPTS